MGSNECFVRLMVQRTGQTITRSIAVPMEMTRKTTKELSNSFLVLITDGQLKTQNANPEIQSQGKPRTCGRDGIRAFAGAGWCTLTSHQEVEDITIHDHPAVVTKTIC